MGGVKVKVVGGGNAYGFGPRHFHRMAGEWRAGVVDDETGVGPPSVASWDPVTVPGRPERFAGASAVAYRKRFPDPRQAAGQRVILDFRGLYGDATVYRNGEVLGHHQNYFEPARFEFEPDDTNDLIVVCRRPTDGYTGVYGTDEVPARLAVPGIWWGVHLRLRPPAFLADLTVNARRPEPDRGVVDVAVSVDAAAAVEDAVTLSVRPENFRGSGGAMERVPVEADAGERVTVTRSVEVRDPTPWWPADRGDPNRYTVRASFREQERAVAAGFSDITFDPDDGLSVNGRGVRARGVNLMPTTDPEADLERARDLGATLVRVHGHVLPESFYDAADDAGVFVFQDLPLTGPDEDGARTVDRGRALARAVVSHVDHHPSLAAYGVHDDPVRPFESRIGSGRSTRYRVRTRAARASPDHALGSAIAEAFPAGANVFKTCGALGTSPDAAHLYPGWDYGRAADVDWLTETYPTVANVVTEFGAGSLTTVDTQGTPAGLNAETLASVLEGLDAGGWGHATDAPDAGNAGDSVDGGTAAEAADAGQGADASPAGDAASSADAVGATESGVSRPTDEVARSQGTQARIVSRVASGFRRHGSAILAGFCLRDVADGGGMGVYTADGRQKPAARALSEALAPVQAFLAGDPPGQVDVVLVNDAPAAVSGTLTATVDAADTAIDGASASFDVEADALGRATAGTLDVPASADVISLAFETGAGEVTRDVYL